MTITRVASYSHSQSLISGLLHNQRDLFETQQQINTGKKAQSYQGYANETSTLVGARSLKSRTDSFVSTSTIMSGELSTIDVNLTAMIEAARSVRQSMLTAIANTDATGLRQSLEQDFQMVASSLNGQIAGRYLFSGSRADVAPFKPDSLDDLLVHHAANDVFANDSVKASGRISDTVDMEFGVLASEVADPLMDVLADLHDYDVNGGGNLTGQLSPTQVSALQSRLAALDSAIANIQAAQVQNGLNQRKLDEISQQMSDRSVYLETFIGDIENVDIAAAIARLQADQTALEASYRTIGSVSQLSLAKYL